MPFALIITLDLHPAKSKLQFTSDSKYTVIYKNYFISKPLNAFTLSSIGGWVINNLPSQLVAPCALFSGEDM